ncbi:hypothetical protein N9948_00705 [bacterium]|nr:hypothetical protein [bacterium]
MTKQIEKKSIVVRAGAINGEELWLDAYDEGLMKFKTKDRDTTWGMYCNYYKVTFEKISEDDAVEIINQKKSDREILKERQ